MINFEQEAVIRIWPFKGPQTPGHAACTIRGIIPTNNIKPIEVVQSYISWWPGRSDSGKSGPLSNRPASPHHSYRTDKRSETGDSAMMRFQDHLSRLNDTSYTKAIGLDDKFLDSRLRNANFAPRDNQKIKITQEEVNVGPYLSYNRYTGELVTSATHNIHLPLLGTKAYYAHTRDSNNKNGKLYVRNDSIGIVSHDVQSKMLTNQRLKHGSESLWGLNLIGMLKWWWDFLVEPENGYQFISKTRNCASVVMGALGAGGIDAYIDTKRATLYYTPNDVLINTKNLEDKIHHLNTDSATFIRSHYILFEQVLNDPQAVELMSPKDFLRMSDSSSLLARRREEVRAIDEALIAYHELLKKTPEWSHENFSAKLKLLVRMMENVIKHRRTKPASERGPGVATLGCQILKVVQAMPQQHGLGFMNFGIYVAEANKQHMQRL